jgi:hypothetical protein
MCEIENYFMLLKIWKNQVGLQPWKSKCSSRITKPWKSELSNKITKSWKSKPSSWNKG